MFTEHGHYSNQTGWGIVAIVVEHTERTSAVERPLPCSSVARPPAKVLKSVLSHSVGLRVCLLQGPNEPIFLPKKFRGKMKAMQSR